MIGFVLDVRNYNAQDISKALELFGNDVRQRIKKYGRIEDQRMALGSQLLIRRLCQQWSISASDIIRNDQTGRPEFFDRQRGDLNVSHHSGRVVLVAQQTAGIKLGVDIVDADEFCREQCTENDWVQPFEQIFTKSELDMTSNDPRRIVQLWALKESLVKALGIGLAKVNLLKIQLESVFFTLQLPCHNYAQVRIDDVLAPYHFDMHLIDGLFVAVCRSTIPSTFSPLEYFEIVNPTTVL